MATGDPFVAPPDAKLKQVVVACIDKGRKPEQKDKKVYLLGMMFEDMSFLCYTEHADENPNVLARSLNRQFKVPVMVWGDGFWPRKPGQTPLNMVWNLEKDNHATDRTPETQSTQSGQ